MSEVSFVLKSFFIALMLVICMQVKVGHDSIENHFMSWVETSAIPVYLQGVATGATIAVRNLSHGAGDFLAKHFNHKNVNETQNASRLNFQIKRSSEVQKNSQPPNSED